MLIFWIVLFDSFVRGGVRRQFWCEMDPSGDPECQHVQVSGKLAATERGPRKDKESPSALRRFFLILPGIPLLASAVLCVIIAVELCDRDAECGWCGMRRDRRDGAENDEMMRNAECDVKPGLGLRRPATTCPRQPCSHPRPLEIFAGCAPCCAWAFPARIRCRRGSLPARIRQSACAAPLPDRRRGTPHHYLDWRDYAGCNGLDYA